MQTRRQFALTATACALASRAQFSPSQSRSFYRNPILGGDHPDASPILVGNDFYLTHSSFDYVPGLLIWHSHDLINWRAVAAGLKNYDGNIWAPYLCEYQGHFYLYFPANGVLKVIHAPHPEGPWSEPIDLGIKAIDPAHIAENGKRYLYMAGGQMAELTPDGLAIATPPRKVVDPWPMPASIRMECTCMEGPKLIEHNGYFYLNLAEGGTAGPATSHAVISARSRHAIGPWEFSPYNPVVHTASRDDRWLSEGHGRLVDTPDGRWYITVHAYENGYRALGRQLLLLPVEWTPDGWWRIPNSAKADGPLPMPVAGATQQPFFDPSDDFTAADLGLQWAFWQEYDKARFTTGSGALILNAEGKSVEDSPALTTPVGGHSYTVEIDIEVTPECEAGLLLFYSPQHYTGIHVGPKGIAIKIPSGSTRDPGVKGVARATFRIVNDRQEVDFYYRLPSQSWKRTEFSSEISGMQHNVLGGFLDVRPALYACGAGHATFRSFRYWPQAQPPA